MDVLGVIPARGGSKSIPRKNLAVVAGRSLLAWTVAAAHDSATLTRTVLSTDDDEIARAGLELGLEVPFMRSPELAADDTPIVPVLLHLLRTLADDDQYRSDVVVLLQPTSPLRTAAHIDQAVQRLIDTGADTIVSVVPVPHQFNPASVMQEVDGRLMPFGSGPLVLRRQDKPLLYARNGPAVVAVRAPVLAYHASLYGPDTRPFVMTPEESVDIDFPWELELASWLLERRKYGATASNPRNPQ